METTFLLTCPVDWERGLGRVRGRARAGGGGGGDEEQTGRFSR